MKEDEMVSIVRHVEDMKICTHTILVGKPAKKRTIGKPGRR
jgi:hypothetical protein